MSQRSGRAAQDEFKLFCSRAGVTCNSSSEDDHGWDFLIEIAPNKEAGAPADKQGGIRKAFVQVKSTHGKNPKTRMKVSNALKLAKDELPCFVVLFHYDRTGGSRKYIRHFWTKLIERALKRGRQASVKSKDTHKSWMEISFSEQDEKSKDPVDWLSSIVRENSDEYSAEKRSLYKGLGYENRNYRAEVTFGPISGLEEIVDHELGLTDALPVSRVRLIDSRFDIDAPEPILDSEHARIQIQRNENNDCSVVLQKADGDLISFEAIMKTTSMLKLPSDKFKMVVESWCFVAVVSIREGLKLDIKDLLNEKLSMEEMAKAAKLRSWGGETVSMKFLGSNLPPLNLQGQCAAIGDEAIFGEMSRTAAFLGDMQSRSAFGGPSHSLEELWQSLRELSFWNCFLNAQDVKLVSEVSVGLESDVSIVGILSFFEFQVGELYYFVVFDAPVLDLFTEQNGMALDCGARVIRDCYVDYDLDKVRSAGKPAHKIESSRRGDDWLDLGDLRITLGIGYGKSVGVD